MAQSERKDDTPGADPAPSPHPLAVELARAIDGAEHARLLMLGIGNGRNVPPFLEAGIRVDAIENDVQRARAAAIRSASAGVRVARARYVGPYPFAGSFAGALSTSALLHGTSAEVVAAVAAVRARLLPGAPFFATFGSVRDPRFANGIVIDAGTVAPRAGEDEAGVLHAYFDEPRLRAMLDGFGDVDAREASAAGTVGAWRTRPSPPPGSCTGSFAVAALRPRREASKRGAVPSIPRDGRVTSRDQPSMPPARFATLA